MDFCMQALYMIFRDIQDVIRWPFALFLSGWAILEAYARVFLGNAGEKIGGSFGRGVGEGLAGNLEEIAYITPFGADLLAGEALAAVYVKLAQSQMKERSQDLAEHALQDEMSYIENQAEQQANEAWNFFIKNK
ncbi:MAG: hypothetical protein JW774_07675 [Candidatus Aureabacteria bacterium]|nr:hypothetical protein [Candidatus Auribacterota bacterium]